MSAAPAKNAARLDRQKLLMIIKKSAPVNRKIFQKFSETLNSHMHHAPEIEKNCRKNIFVLLYKNIYKNYNKKNLFVQIQI